MRPFQSSVPMAPPQTFGPPPPPPGGQWGRRISYSLTPQPIYSPSITPSAAYRQPAPPSITSSGPISRVVQGSTLSSSHFLPGSSTMMAPHPVGVPSFGHAMIGTSALAQNPTMLGSIGPNRLPPQTFLSGQSSMAPPRPVMSLQMPLPPPSQLGVGVPSLPIRREVISSPRSTPVSKSVIAPVGSATYRPPPVSARPFGTTSFVAPPPPHLRPLSNLPPTMVPMTQRQFFFPHGMPHLPMTNPVYTTSPVQLLPAPAPRAADESITVITTVCAKSSMGADLRDALKALDASVCANELGETASSAAAPTADAEAAEEGAAAPAAEEEVAAPDAAAKEDAPASAKEEDKSGDGDSPAAEGEGEEAKAAEVAAEEGSEGSEEAADANPRVLTLKSFACYSSVDKEAGVIIAEYANQSAWEAHANSETLRAFYEQDCIEFVQHKSYRCMCKDGH